MDAGLEGYRMCPLCEGEVVKGVYFPNRVSYRYHLAIHNHFEGGSPMAMNRTHKEVSA